MSAVQGDPDDEQILGYARELFRQFHITKPDPDTVSWDDTLSPDPVLVKYGEVKLPRHMKGKLTPEDWRLLLAPSMVYMYVLYPNFGRGTLVRVMLPQTVAVFLMTYFLLQIFKITDSAYARELTISHTWLHGFHGCRTSILGQLVFKEPHLRLGPSRRRNRGRKGSIAGYDRISRCRVSIDTVPEA